MGGEVLGVVLAVVPHTSTPTRQRHQLRIDNCQFSTAVGEPLREIGKVVADAAEMFQVFIVFLDLQ